MMERNPESFRFLSQCLLDVLSPSPEPRRHAQAYLSAAADRRNFGIALLQLISDLSVNEHIRQSAAVMFKNHVRTRWSPLPPKEANAPTRTPILDSEKQQIKALIVPLMLRSSSQILSRLSEALSLISKHDFPQSWPNLLPELVSSLKPGNDYTVVNGILGTANSIFEKFRYQHKTNELLIELKYCLDIFAAPLMEIFLKTAALIKSAAGTSGPSVAAALKPLFESQLLCCRIFYSFNFQDLPECFKDNMKEWMGEFREYLTKSYPTLEEGNPAGLAIVDDLRSAVCEIISLYMEKNEELFQGFLNDFARAVWGLLGKVSISPTRDGLPIKAIKFLTAVSSSVHYALFAGEGAIQQICRDIVIPNVRLRDEDEEIFEMNYVEFIRSDRDTRRSTACELLKGITTNYRDQVRAVVSGEIQNLLASYATNPVGNWKDKECAMYLVVSLATKKVIFTDLVDVQNFFGSVIVPELQSQDVNGFPMLKAGALKFFSMFGNQISKPVTAALIPEVVRFLCVQSNVVHSYAASCIEKHLLVKDGGGRARYTSVDSKPFLLVLMTNLLKALEFPGSEENPYVMKCIMRVLGVVDLSFEDTVHCFTPLSPILRKVCKNPKNPIFNHYLFESVAIIVRRSCERDSSLLLRFEAELIPSFLMISANDVAEFSPYALQLLAQLVELNRTPIPTIYMRIFDLFLKPESWNRAANVTALVCLLQAFLRKASDELNHRGKLSQVFGIFGRLVGSPLTDKRGFYLLNTIVENLEYDVISPYNNEMWASLSTRLEHSRTPTFLKSLLMFMSLFLINHGSINLMKLINVQPDQFLVILEEFWIPNLKLVTGSIELKLAYVASTSLILESPVLLDVSSANHWGKLLDSILSLISRSEQDRLNEEEFEDPDIREFEALDIGETVGYTDTIAHLFSAQKKEDDPLKDIKDPKEFLISSLANVSARFPGRFPRVISETVDWANQQALLQLCSTYNLTIV